MAISQRDQIGIVILVGLFAVLIGLYIWFSPAKPERTYAPEDSPIVQRRLEILDSRDR